MRLSVRNGGERKNHRIPLTERVLEIQNLEILDNALALGKGVIFVGGHFGNWEIIMSYIRSKGYSGASIVKKMYFHKYNEFVKKIPEDKIYTDELNRLAYGTDASFYRLIPEIVVKVKNTEEALVKKFGIDKYPTIIALTDPENDGFEKYEAEMNID